MSRLFYQIDNTLYFDHAALQDMARTFGIPLDGLDVLTARPRGQVTYRERQLIAI